MSAEKKLTGSIPAKIVAFFLLAISFAIAGAGTVMTLYMAEEGIYHNGKRVLVEEGLEEMAYRDYCYLRGMDGFLLNSPDKIADYCEGTNLRVEIYSGGSLLWGNYDGEESLAVYSFDTFAHTVYSDGTGRLEAGNVSDKDSGNTANSYRIKLYIDGDLSAADGYRSLYSLLITLYDLRYAIPIGAIAAVILFFVCFVFLMCSAGHKNGREGIVPSLLNAVYLDVCICIYGGGMILLALLAMDFWHSINDILELIAEVTVFGTAMTVWTTLFCMEAMTRLKLGDWWKNTLIYILFGWVGKVVRGIVRGMLSLLCKIPLVLNTMIAFLGLCILEFVGLIFWGSGELAVVWCMEKAVLFFVVLYAALICKKLQEGSEALAGGDLRYQIDTSHMFLDFKEHGENLNRISQGMAAAVEQQIKSEHLKTELITNVSHDIKTPLTSIINYADLISAEQTENEKITEYAKVLLRQSGRLKKLLEDLVEASKATTGNLEVNLQPCEVGVLLAQTVGEYEEKFQDRQLQLITRQPKEQVMILADGRHLWRVFDNLLNNICKYAQENSRVYLTVEERDGEVQIIFRNMSRYALDISAEELKERFVRGDRSRHLEGNGLGLSITESLIELQNGHMDIVIDGDLFKVVLEFQEICCGSGEHLL